jgi:hydroxylamine reductase (hybrid-cluster protein)
MKEIHKKSADAAVNKLIVKAYRSQTDLAWDRAEAMQPQCGFGRMGICCTDCYEGPCRVNPFAETEQYSICGRNQQDLMAGFFLKKAVGGAAALVNLAEEFGANNERMVLNSVLQSGDVMVAPTDYSKRYGEIGETVVQALSAINGIKEKGQSSVTAANLGVLQADSVNILLHGHIPPRVTALLTTAAAKQSDSVNLIGMCGGEASGSDALPVATNYDSQETPLLTGAVDLLVVGGQCVMPAVIALAAKMGVAVVNASTLIDSATADQALLKAATGFIRRAGRSVDIPDYKTAMAVGGYASFAPTLTALAKGYAKGLVNGIVYLGGCGNITHTQDATIVKLAKNLSDDGYFVVTAGCAGVALAKAGMCQAGSSEGWKAVLPKETSPVLYVGACHDAGEFLLIASAAAEQGLPVFAVIPEISHSKPLATAIGFLAQGITTYVEISEVAHVPEISLQGRLLPLSELRQLPQTLAEIAAAAK